MSRYTDEPWFKISRRVFDSSVWEEDTATRCLWFTLLALAQLPENRKHGHGVVAITPGNLTRKAYISAAEFEHAMARLTAPDPHSRTSPGSPRLEVLPNGYRILNFDLYNAAGDYDRWHAQRVEAGKARAAGAPRDGGRFTSDKPADAGPDPAKPLAPTRKTETEKRTMEPLTREPGGVRAAEVDSNGPATAPPALRRWIVHDPNDPLQVRVAQRCYALATMVADGERVTADDVRDVLTAITTTAHGTALERADLRNVKEGWLTATLAAADRFEEDHRP